MSDVCKRCGADEFIGEDLLCEDCRELLGLREKVDALKAENERLRKCHESEIGVCYQHCDEVIALKQTVADLEGRLEEAVNDTWNVLNDIPASNGQYFHVITCSGARNKPMGPGNSCSCLNLPLFKRLMEPIREQIRAKDEALEKLIKAIDRVTNSPEYKSIWIIAQLHAGMYRGPSYELELETARQLLATNPTAG